jgi:3'-phosphoadenosine 5'-phosphosulfate sulfotransferase (PAPS reductase)/FAD synthetase
VKTPEQVIEEAMAFKPVAIRVGFSGGRDSIAVTHWMMNNVPDCEVFHCNTGIGIEKTREYVRETCRQFGWPLHEIRAKEDCGQDYDEIVKRYGFPGAGQHSKMYIRLKERPIDYLIRNIPNRKRGQKVLLAMGIRHEESTRRMRYVGQEVTRIGSKVWCNPIYWWSANQRDSYNRSQGLPINPVSETLGMSGECLCGAFAHEGEKALVKLICPQTAARIENLEEQTLARGFTWDWEGSPPENFTLDQSDMFMPMCVGCEKVHMP